MPPLTGRVDTTGCETIGAADGAGAGAFATGAGLGAAGSGTGAGWDEVIAGSVGGRERDVERRRLRRLHGRLHARRGISLTR